MSDTASEEDPISFTPRPLDDVAKDSFVTWSASEIDEGIKRHDKSHPPPKNPGKVKWKGVPDPTNYKFIAEDIQNEAEPDRTKRLKADLAAIELRLVETRELQPLYAKIDKAEQTLRDLQSTAGIDPGDERINAAKAELSDLYTDQDFWESRASTLMVNMKMDERSNRLDEINAQHQEEMRELALKGPKGPTQIKFADTVKTHDGTPRQKHELQVTAALTAKNYIGRVPMGGIRPEELKSALGQSYGKAYVSDSPQRLGKDGRPIHIKGAEIGAISDLEKIRLAGQLQSTVDKVNEIQGTIKRAEDKLNGEICDRLASNPSALTDDQVRQSCEQAQQKLQTAASRVQHCDARLSKLQAPSFMEKVKAVFQHGGVTKARQHYVGEKAAAETAGNVALQERNKALEKPAQQIRQTSEEGIQLTKQNSVLAAQQDKILQDFHDETQVKAALIKPKQVQGDQVKVKFDPPDPNVHQTVRGILKNGSPKDVNLGTVLKEEVRQEREENIKPIKSKGQEDLHPGEGPKLSGVGKEPEGGHDHSLRKTFKPTIKPLPTGGGNHLGTG